MYVFLHACIWEFVYVCMCERVRVRSMLCMYIAYIAEGEVVMTPSIF